MIRIVPILTVITSIFMAISYGPMETTSLRERAKAVWEVSQNVEDAEPVYALLEAFPILSMEEPK